MNQTQSVALIEKSCADTWRVAYRKMVANLLLLAVVQAVLVYLGVYNGWSIRTIAFLPVVSTGLWLIKSRVLQFAMDVGAAEMERRRTPEMNAFLTDAFVNFKSSVSEE